MLPEGQSFKVCWLVLDGGNCPTLDYLNYLADTDKKCFGSVVDKMQRLSDSRYHKPKAVTPLKGKARGMFELRVMGGKRQYARLPFVLSSQREVVLLFGVTKKGASPPPGFINRAVDYMNKLNTQEAQYERIGFTGFNE